MLKKGETANGEEKLIEELSFVGIPLLLAQSIIQKKTKMISIREEDPFLYISLQQRSGNQVWIKRTAHTDIDPITKKEKKCYHFQISSLMSYLAGTKPTDYRTFII